MRAIAFKRAGRTRLARRDAEFYSIEITCQGSASYLKVTDGRNAPLFFQPSAFTGSFVLACHAPGGLIVDMDGGTPATVTINWREETADVV
jgi:hypothetical protein